MREIKKLLIAFFLITFTGLIGYSNSLRSPFVLDDATTIVENSAIKNISNVALIWQQTPLRFIPQLTFAFNYHFFGLNVFYYHIFNILIHILTAVSIFLFFRMLITSSLKRTRATAFWVPV